MAINDTQKLDYLWKKLGYGVTKTDVNNVKAATNESIASPLLLRGDKLWADSNLIPSTIPNASTATVEIYNDTGNGSATIECSADLTSTPNRTWTTGITDWIPPEFGSTYQVKVYIDNASSAAPQTTGTQIFAAGSGNDDEWFFDYQSGVLHFIGTNLPSGISGNTIYIVGARYIGPFGSNSSSITTDNIVADTAEIGSLTVTDLTNNRIVIAGINGEIEDDANFRFDGTSFLIGPNLSETFTVEVSTGNTDIQGTLAVLGRTILSSAAVEDLTSGRVVLAGTDGEIEDSANLTFDGTTLVVTGAAEIDNVKIDGNTISSTTGDILIDPSPAGSAGTVTIAGNLAVQGTTTTIDSTVTTIEDPIITLGGDTAPTVDDSKDRGVEFRWHNGTSDKLGFFGWDRSAEAFTFIPDATNSSEIFSGSEGKIVVGNIEDKSLTENRLVIVGANGLLEDDTNLTWNGSTLNINGQTTVDSLNVEDLTSGRVVLAGTNGELEDNANLTFDGTTLDVTGSLDVTNDVTISGNTTLGDAATDTVSINGEVDTNVVPAIDVTYDLGSAVKRWNTIYGNALSTVELQGGNIKISSNVIENVSENEGIIIRPNGSGTIEMDATSAVKLPTGGDGERPSTPAEGQIRYNNTNQRVENYNNETWISLATEDDAIAFAIALG